MWLFGCLLAICAAVGLLKHYAEPRIRWEFLFLVGFSWSLGFMYFLVLPFDLEHAFCRACVARTQDASECRCLPAMGIEALETLIPVAYGCARAARCHSAAAARRAASAARSITMLLGYVMNDVIREYLLSGEFTRRGRMRDALREAAIFYVPVLIIGLMCAHAPRRARAIGRRRSDRRALRRSA